MRTVEECLAKAAEFQQRATNCEAPALRGECLIMAESRKEVARQAHWQDQPELAWFLPAAEDALFPE
jgi:hypothetical protein